MFMRYVYEPGELQLFGNLGRNCLTDPADRSTARMALREDISYKVLEDAPVTIDHQVCLEGHNELKRRALQWGWPNQRCSVTWIRVLVDQMRGRSSITCWIPVAASVTPGRSRFGIIESLGF